MNESFFEKLERTCEARGSLLCVGLDPRLEGDERQDPGAAILEQNRRVIEQTLPYACCYKPNIAFYEAWGLEGLRALLETLALIPPDTPVILDAKRGDIGPTAEAYAQALFSVYRADAVTVSPYLGRESVEPLLRREGKGLFVLCRTSNPQAGDLQHLAVRGREPGQETPLYLEVAREAVSWGRQVGLVVGATDAEALERVRAAHPDTWLLCPGVGAQGGSLEQAVRAGRRADGRGLLLNVSRAISAAPRPGEQARALRDQINRELELPRPAPTPAPARTCLLQRLVDQGCLKFGQFRLKSGQLSPYYLDLRKVISSPSLLALAAEAYASLLPGLEFDRIAAVPLAALPLAAAVSLKTGVPFVYPRMAVKEHGTGNAIEGDFRPGERVVLLDDVISTAKSKLEAIEVLQREGLRVTDLVVLVDRESGGPQEMERHGVRCRSYARISQLLELAGSRPAPAEAR